MKPKSTFYQDIWDVIRVEVPERWAKRLNREVLLTCLGQGFYKPEKGQRPPDNRLKPGERVKSFNPEFKENVRRIGRLLGEKVYMKRSGALLIGQIGTGPGVPKFWIAPRVRGP